ncbi:MAG: hypothetical protein Q8Q09_10190 [Deltaproteobacteria bacterium]|nr:hypothetical protein [Deltaproteobacteria bacterium]
MGAAYLSQVIAKSDTTATIRVLQTHTGYHLNPAPFLDEFGALALAGWAFSDGYAYTHYGHTSRTEASKDLVPEGQHTALGKKIGSFDKLFDNPASMLEGISVTKTTVVREALTEKNTAERLVAAGHPSDQELFYAIALQICGQLDIEIAAQDPALLAPLAVGAEWEY